MLFAGLHRESQAGVQAEDSVQLPPFNHVPQVAGCSEGQEVSETGDQPVADVEIGVAVVESAVAGVRERYRGRNHIGRVADFFTIEAWTERGLQRFIVLLFIELSTRKVEIAGIAPIANRLWMNQIGRN